MKKFLRDMESLGFEPKQAFEFHPKQGYVPAKGDLVKLTTTLQEVELADDGDAIRGVVDVVYSPLQGKTRLTVALFGQRAGTVKASGAVAINDDLIGAGANKLRKAEDGEVAVAFAITSAADGEEFEVIYK